MNRFILLVFIASVSLPVLGQNKDTVTVSITNYSLHPGTFSWRNTGTFHDMTSWNSSPYGEGHLKQNGLFRMNFRLLQPQGHNPAYQPGYPLIVMLHGAGERANCWSENCYCEGCSANDTPDPNADPRYLNNDHNISHGGSAHLNARNLAGTKLPNDPTLAARAFPGFVLFPQMNNQWRNSASPAASDLSNAIRIIRLLCKQYNIDQDRIYIHGLSMGGQAALEALNFADWLFAAAAPMSAIPFGGGLEYDSVRNIPFWIFQGGKDGSPKPSQTETMIRQLREKGANVRYSLYPNLGHGTWNTAYAEPDFFSWLLSKRKSNIHVDYDNPNICGTTGQGATLVLADGFPAYQWERDGEIIPGATEHIYVANFPGVYRARFSRKSANPTEAEWNRWSDPVAVGEKSPEAPVIEQEGTTILSNLNGESHVILKAPEGYVKYTWSHNGQAPANPTNITVQDDPHVVMIKGCTGGGPCVRSGAYTVVTEGFDKCPSLPSEPKYIIWGTHNLTNFPPVVQPKPTGLTGVVKSPTSILLTWNDNSPNERHFEIWRRKHFDGAGFANWVLVKITGEDETMFLDTGLDANSTYWYKVRGINNQGRSEYAPNNSASNENHSLRITTPGESVPPTPPSNLTANAVGVEMIELAWQRAIDASGIKQYIVYYNGTQFETNSSDTTLVLTSSQLDLNQSYSFTVRAQDNGLNLSAPSNPAVAHTFVEGLYYKHTTGAWTDLDEATMVASWTSPEYTGWVPNFTLQPRTQDDFFNFEFSGYLYITTGGTYEFRLTSDDGSRLYLNNNVIVNHDGTHGNTTKVGDYSVNLTANNSYPIMARYFENTGGQSLTVQYRRTSWPSTGWTTIPDAMLRSGNPPPLPIPPPAPDNLSASATGMQSIDLAWQYNGPMNPDITFEVQRAPSENGPFLAVGRTTATTFADAGLIPDNTYHYRIRTTSADTVSTFTNLANATTFPDEVLPTTPGTPTLLAKKFSTVSFTWAPESTDNIQIAGYEIYQDNQYIGFALSNAYSVTGLEPGQSYTFHVRAVDLNDNKSAPSGNLNVQTDFGNTYISKPGSSELNTLATWEDSQGDPPASFEHNGQFFVVKHPLPVNAPWEVQGSVSKVIIDDGVTVSVNSNPIYAKVEIPGNGVLNIANLTQPQLTNLSSSSTVNYTNKFVQKADYGNLGLLAPEAFTFPEGVTRVRGNLTASNGASLKGASANSTTIELTGDLIVNGSPAPMAPGFAIDFSLIGNGNHQITTGGPLDLYRIQKAGSGTVTLQNSGSPVSLYLGSSQGGGLYLSSSAELILGNNTLSIVGAGAIDPSNNGGPIAVSNGTVSVSSNGALNSNLRFKPGANTLFRLEQNMRGAGQVIVRNPVNVTDGIKIRSGNLDANGMVTLVSTASKTANLEEIENGGAVLNNMTVQRHVSNKTRTYRYIAASVEGVTVADWQAFFPITGNFQGTSTGSGLTTQPSLYIREPQGWVAYPPAGTSNQLPIEKGRGYAAFVRNNTPITISVSGVPFQGRIDYGNLIPQQGGDPILDWNLLANPYPSTIAWSNDPEAWDKSGFGNTIAVRDNLTTTTGRFQYFDAVTLLGTFENGLDEGKIAPGQAFWAQAIDANPRIAITEKAKHTGQQTLYRDSKTPASHLRLTLTRGTQQDAALIVLTSFGTDRYDQAFDGLKMSNEGLFNLSTMTENEYAVAINNLSDAFCSKTVAINISNTPVGTYTLKIPAPETLYGAQNLKLYDRHLDSLTRVNGETTYAFNITSDPATFNGRFELTFDRPGLMNDILAETTPACDGPRRVTLKNTQPGASYALFLGENAITESVTSSGQDLLIDVPESVLREGTNAIHVEASFRGCSSVLVRNLVSIEYYGKPVVHATDVSVCAGEPAELHASALSGSIAAYKWYDETSAIKGVNASTLVTAPVQFTRTYAVQGVDPNGCAGNRTTITVTPETLIEPEILVIGDTLISSSPAEKYSWYRNGEPVKTNSLSNYLVASENGEYSLAVRKGGCVRNSRAFVVTGFEEISTSHGFEVYPNPTVAGNINLKVRIPEMQNLRVAIVDVVGRQFYTSAFPLSPGESIVPIRPSQPLRSGVYFLKIEGDSRTETLKFIIE